MDTNKYKINISIDSKKYELYINSCDEELFRKTASELNKKIIALKSNWKVQDHIDYITIVAFQLLFDKLQQEMVLKEDKTTESLNKILEKLDNI